MMSSRFMENLWFMLVTLYKQQSENVLIMAVVGIKPYGHLSIKAFSPRWFILILLSINDLFSRKK